MSQVVAGGLHSCAIVGDGEVYCWGQNDVGQLGDGTQSGRPFAKPVLQSPGDSPLTGVQALALGYRHSCALLTGGEARCWGRNDYGQLGDGTQTDRLTPVPVLQSPGGVKLAGVQALALGGVHSCALLTSGEVRCWGHNSDGQLGDGTTTDRLAPVPVLEAPGGPPLTGVQALALGYRHSCALLTGGEARCWGYNVSGQLGDGTTTHRLGPVPVLEAPGGLPLTGVQALALSGVHSCASLTSGEVRCWGQNWYGQLGDGTQTDRLTPVPVLQAPGGPPLTGVQALALGGMHSCASLTSGEVRCWGANSIGQLGDGTTTQRLTPVPVRVSPGGPSLTGVQALTLGGGHSCARLSTGEASCWGYNDYAQLGDGTTTQRLTPVPVRVSPGGPSLTGVQALALGGMHSCASLTSGEARCWGYNVYGQLGDGTISSQPSPVPVLLPPSSVSPLGARPSALPASIDSPPFGLLSPTRSLAAPFVSSSPSGPSFVVP